MPMQPYQCDALNEDLREVLSRRASAGVRDIKGHVEVTAATEPADVKRALVNVLSKAEAGTLQRFTLDQLGSFEELYARLT